MKIFILGHMIDWNTPKQLPWLTPCGTKLGPDHSPQLSGLGGFQCKSKSDSFWDRQGSQRTSENWWQSTPVMRILREKKGVNVHSNLCPLYFRAAYLMFLSRNRRNEASLYDTNYDKFRKVHNFKGTMYNKALCFCSTNIYCVYYMPDARGNNGPNLKKGCILKCLDVFSIFILKLDVT